VDWTKEMVKVFLKSHIPVIRIGLQPTDLITEGKEVRMVPSIQHFGSWSKVRIFWSF
jgi:hypothetical protein